MRVRRAVPDLLRTLDEDTLDLRIPIVRALGRIGHGDSFKALHERFVRESETEVRAAYIEAFGGLPNPQIVPQLIDLSKPEQPWPERRAAIRALGVLRAPEAKAPLLQALRDPDQIVSREALSALRLIMTPDEFRRTEEALTNALRRQEMFQQNFQEGLRHLRQGALAEAEKSLKTAARINPKAGYVYSALGNLYYKTGKLIDATKAYVMAVTIEPRDVTLRLNLGMVYYRRRAFREALEVFAAIAKMVDPKSQQGLYAVKMQQKIKLEASRNPANLKG
jgi:tetratricopeptide (TPR) repeat protein